MHILQDLVPYSQIWSSSQIWSTVPDIGTRTYLVPEPYLSRWVISVKVDPYLQARFLLMEDCSLVDAVLLHSEGEGEAKVKALLMDVIFLQEGLDSLSKTVWTPGQARS